MSYIPKIRVGIVGHGDYCDSRLMDKLDFTDDVNKIVKFVQEVPATGGGDYPEAYEYGRSRSIINYFSHLCSFAEGTGVQVAS